MINNDQSKKEDQGKDASVKPDPETLNTSDPQDHMEGPVSSLVQKTKDIIQNNDESKTEADAKKERNM